MSNIPSDLRYSKTHEWVKTDSDGTVTIGITDHAQALLGDMVFVELPEVDIDVVAEGEIAVVESVKAASDVYSPIAGKIIAVNETLGDDPALVNSDPYGAGWLFKLAPEDANAINALFDADAYSAQIESE